MLRLGEALIFILLISTIGLKSRQAFASTYEQAIKAYKSENYKLTVKIANRVAKKSEDTEKARAYVLSGAAYIEIGNKSKASIFFNKALTEDDTAILPSFVKNPATRRLFAKVKERKSGKLFFGFGGSNSEADGNAKNAFDSLETYYPFGVNQMLQGKLFLGSTVGILQGFAFFNFFKNFNDANEQQSELDRLSVEARDKGNENNPVFIDFAENSQGYIDKKKTSAYLSLAGGIILYGASIYEAGYYPPPPAAKAKSTSVPGVLPLAHWDSLAMSLGWDMNELRSERFMLRVSRRF